MTIQILKMGYVYGTPCLCALACPKLKSSPVTGPEWPRGFQEVKVPRFHANSTGWWLGCQPYAPAAFTPRAIVRSEGFYVNEKSTETSWDRTSDLPICSTAP